MKAPSQAGAPLFEFRGKHYFFYQGFPDRSSGDAKLGAGYSHWKEKAEWCGCLPSQRILGAWANSVVKIFSRKGREGFAKDAKGFSSALYVVIQSFRSWSTE